MTRQVVGPVVDPGRLATAVALLQARRAGTDVPEGRWDRAGRWHPAPEEQARCCARHRSTLTAEQAARLHCLGAAHIAVKCGVPEKALIAAARSTRPGARSVSTDVDAS